MFMVCHKLAPMTSSKTSTQGSTLQVTEWVNGFLWGCTWIITSALATRMRAKRASNGSCWCLKFLRQFACPDAHWLQYTSHFSACGTALQGHTKSFWQESIQVCLCLLIKFVGTCSERIQLPFRHCSSILLQHASKNASCGPAVTLALFKL